MEQKDLDRLTRRVVHMVRDMMSPDADYRVIMIVGERQADGVKLSLGSNAAPDLAMMLCEMATREYAAQLSNSGFSALVGLVKEIMDLLNEKLADQGVVSPAKEKEPEPPEPSATKH